MYFVWVTKNIRWGQKREDVRKRIAHRFPDIERNADSLRIYFVTIYGKPILTGYPSITADLMRAKAHHAGNERDY